MKIPRRVGMDATRAQAKITTPQLVLRRPPVNQLSMLTASYAPARHLYSAPGRLDSIRSSA
jgi:hypothetical protein